MKTIMVQLSDNQWTMEAMHFASALARNVDGKIVLLRLVLANNPGLLGWGVFSPTEEERHQIETYAAVAEDYGVEFWVQPMHYVTLVNALAQAAEQNDVSVLFAHLSPSPIRFWRRFQRWNLRRKLRNCRLYTLDEKYPPSVEEPMSLPANSVKITLN